MGILVGYDSVGYRVLLNNKIIRARHVDIVSRDTNLIGFGANDDDNDNENDNVENSENNDFFDVDENVKNDKNSESNNEIEKAAEPELRRLERETEEKAL